MSEGFDGEMPRMAYFGKLRDAPVYDGAPEVQTPVGEHCVWCERAIVQGEDGFQYVSGEYTHLYCNLRSVLGKDLADEVVVSLLAREVS